MSKIFVPKGYSPQLSLYETQTAIGFIKRTFEDRLTKALNLKRVSAPLFVDPNTGINDDLNGVERPVAFDIAETGTTAQVVHSLAKWKRYALHQYGFSAGEGLYTDMNAIRRDEEMSNLHSIYVDQWDWEKIITAATRNEAYLNFTESEIYSRYEILLEGYSKVLHIESLTMIEMVKKDIIPAVVSYVDHLTQAALHKRALLSTTCSCDLEEGLINELSSLSGCLYKKLNALDECLISSTFANEQEKANYYKDSVFPAMQELRAVADEIETLVGRTYWPYPTYGDLLFSL